MKTLCLPFFLIVSLFSGCASYVAHLEPAKSLKGYNQFFVKTNFDDNHGLGERITRSLQARGFTVANGPMTMMPPTAQAVVAYDDRWNWDFKTHLTYLRITVSDSKSELLVASGAFTGPASMATSPDEAVEQLLAKIIAAKPFTKPAPKK